MRHDGNDTKRTKADRVYCAMFFRRTVKTREARQSKRSRLPYHLSNEEVHLVPGTNET